MFYFFDLKEQNGRYYVFSKNLDLIKIDNFSFDTFEPKKEIYDAYLSIPISWLDFRVLEVPFKEEKKIKEILPFELEGLILSNSAEITYDFVILEKKEKTKILIIYIKKDLLQKLLEKFDQKKINIKVVTCIYLKKFLADFRAEYLLEPNKLSEEERIKLAKEELISPSFNLKKIEIISPIKLKKQKKLLQWTIFLSILILFFWLIDFYFNWWAIKKQTENIKNKMHHIYSTLFPEEKRIVSPLYQLQSHFKTLKEKENILVGISPLDILLKLSKVKRNGIIFREIHMDKKRVIIKGIANSLSNIDNVKKQLEQVWSQAKILDSKVLEPKKIHFTIMVEDKKE